MPFDGNKKGSNRGGSDNLSEKNGNYYSPSARYLYGGQSQQPNVPPQKGHRSGGHKRSNDNHLLDRLAKQNDTMIRLLKEIRDRLPSQGVAPSGGGQSGGQKSKRKHKNRHKNQNNNQNQQMSEEKLAIQMAEKAVAEHEAAMAASGNEAGTTEQNQPQGEPAPERAPSEQAQPQPVAAEAPADANEQPAG